MPVVGSGGEIITGYLIRIRESRERKGKERKAKKNECSLFCLSL